jgi:hypothetical protein
MRAQKEAPKTLPGKWRRVPSEKWKEAHRVDRPPESFHDCEVAIKTGHPMTDGRRLYVFDVDLKNPMGQATWDDLIKKYPKVWGGACSRTESGGYHFLFASAEEYRIHIGLFPGIDFLGMGGLSFEPPSQFSEGNVLREQYRWQLAPNGPESIPELPEFLVAHLKMEETKDKLQAERFAHFEDEGRLPLSPGPSLDWLGLLLARHTPQSGLEYLPWLRIGMALHESTGGADEALDLWDAWGERVAQERGGDYDSRTTRIKWDSFGAGSGAGKVGFGTLVRVCLTDPAVVAFVQRQTETWGALAARSRGERVDEGQERLEIFEQDDLTEEDSLLNEFAGLESGPNQALGDVPKNVPPEIGAKREPEDECLAPKARKRKPRVDTGEVLIPEIVSAPPAVAVMPAHDSEKIPYLAIDPLAESICTAMGISQSQFRLNECVGCMELHQSDGTVRRFDDALRAEFILRCRDFGVYRHVQPLTIKDNIDLSLMRIAWMNRYHPIRAYLRRCQEKYSDWLMIQSLSGENPSYRANRDLLYSRIDFGRDKETDRQWFIRCFEHWIFGCVARVLWGHQNRMLILEGIQGKGKSSLAEALAKGIKGYFSRGAIDPDNKDHKIRLFNNFVWEVDELGSTTRGDINKLKSFITLSNVNERLPYGRYAMEFPAVCSFIGTTNDSKYLRDATGNRRFLVTKFSQVDGFGFWEWLFSSEFNPDLLWGEILEEMTVRGLFMPPVDSGLFEEASGRAESVRVVSDIEDVLEDVLVKDSEGHVTKEALRRVISEQLGNSVRNVPQLVGEYLVRILGKDEVEGFRRVQGKFCRVWLGVSLRTDQKPNSAEELARIAKEARK